MRRAHEHTSSGSRPTVSSAIFGGDFHATNLDLVLASLIALGLPFATSWLYTATGGATASLILYYVVCCVIVVLWRKRTLDYHRPARWPWLLLGLSLLLPLANAALNWGTLPNAHAPLWGLLVTALVWAPMNAALEQLSWFYVFDAWRNRWRAGNLRWVGLVGRRAAARHAGGADPHPFLVEVSAGRHQRAARLPHTNPQPRPDGGVRRALLHFALDVAGLHHPLPGGPATRPHRRLLDCPYL